MSTLRKKPGLKSRVLFIRCDLALVRAIQERKSAEQRTHPGRTISMADVVRSLLYEGLQGGASR
jgi:hypothetical protein